MKRLTMDLLMQSLGNAGLDPILKYDEARARCPHVGHGGDRDSRSSRFRVVPCGDDPTRLRVSWCCYSHGCDEANYSEVMEALGLGSGYEDRAGTMTYAPVSRLNLPTTVTRTPEPTAPDGLHEWLYRCHKELMSEEGTGTEAWAYARSRWQPTDLVLNLVGRGVADGVPDGYEGLVGKLVVPVLDADGVAVVAQGRRVGSGEGPKWTWPRGRRPGPGFILPARPGEARRLLDPDGLLVVVEGPADGMALAGVGVQALVAGGTHGLTANHAARLRDAGVQVVVLGYDADDAGRRGAEVAAGVLADVGIASLEAVGPTHGRDWGDLYDLDYGVAQWQSWHRVGEVFAAALTTTDGTALVPHLAQRPDESPVRHGIRLLLAFQAVREVVAA